jgi:hypothetical protein
MIKKTKISKTELGEIFQDYCLEKCNVCYKELVLSVEDVFCPSCKGMEEIENNLFIKIVNEICEKIKGRVDNLLGNYNLIELRNTLFIERSKLGNDFLGKEPSLQMKMYSWLAIEYLIIRINEDIITSGKINPSSDQTLELINFSEKYITLKNYILDKLNGIISVYYTQDINESLLFLIGDFLGDRRGFHIYIRPIMKRINLIFNYLGIYPENTNPDDRKGLDVVAKKFNLELYKYKEKKGIFLELANFMTGISFSSINNQILNNINDLRNSGLTFQNFLTLYEKISSISSNNLVILKLDQLYDLVKESGINLKQFSLLVNFSPKGRLSKLKMKRIYLQSKLNAHIDDIEEKDTSLFCFCNELVTNIGIQNEVVIIDPMSVLIHSIFLARYNTDFWDEKQQYDSNLFENEIVKKIFDKYGYKFYPSNEIDEISRDNKLMTKSRGQIDGIATKFNKIFVIESKFLVLPNGNWVNKFQLGLLASQILGIIDGHKISHKVVDLKREYYKVEKKYNLISKTNWVRENYLAMKISYEEGIIPEPLIITNIASPITNEKINYKIISIIELEQFLDSL